MGFKILRVLILGGDGYLGWPTAMHFASLGDEVSVVDNYFRREIAHNTNSEPLVVLPKLKERVELFKKLTGREIKVFIGDLNEYSFLEKVLKDVCPDVVVHYAEQPSAPYSMMGLTEARTTLQNNLNVTFNCIWGIKEFCPNAHIIKLGTMGEYGTPNIDIEEGWLEINHKGRSDKFLFPRAAGSLYHTTKILDTDLIWFYVRNENLRVTDLMQGPVYGHSTPESSLHPRLGTNFHYDDIFGTVINRFLVQAVAGIPLTVYGNGGQTRGYLNLIDTLKCVELAAKNPAAQGELKIFNQFTETFSVSELAEKIRAAGIKKGLNVQIENIENPRKENENHYYNPTSTGLKDLGLEPTTLTSEVLESMFDLVIQNRESIDRQKVMPRVSWNKN